MSINRILNSYNFKEISKLAIDNENKSLTVSLSDDNGDEHDVVLLDVDNYQVFDSSIYKEIYHMDTRGDRVSFMSDILSSIGFVQVTKTGRETVESFAKPNFIVDSKDRSILAEANNLEINGILFPLKEKGYN